MIMVFYCCLCKGKSFILLADNLPCLYCNNNLWVLPKDMPEWIFIQFGYCSVADRRCNFAVGKSVYLLK